MRERRVRDSSHLKGFIRLIAPIKKTLFKYEFNDVERKLTKTTKKSNWGKMFRKSQLNIIRSQQSLGDESYVTVINELIRKQYTSLFSKSSCI